MKISTSKYAAALLVLLGTAAMSSTAFAHNPIAQCQKKGKDNILCKGGFSDGSDAVGVTLDVISYDEKILLPGKLGKDSTLTFKRPKGDFYVLFDAGPGHIVEIDHAEIE
jgi:hypothetical protein